jgi:hypothetical protein
LNQEFFIMTDPAEQVPPPVPAEQVPLPVPTEQITPPVPVEQIPPPVPAGQVTPLVPARQVTPLDSGWKQFLDFLWNGGFRSVIVLTVIVGAGWITVDNQKICPNVPTTTGSKDGIALVSNPTCSKYFDLVLAIVGGYLGLSLPRSVQGSSSQSSNDQNNQAGSGEG